MKKYQGISTEYDKDNNIKIMVRFMYEGKHYPIKNFTKLFGCKTQAQASKKLDEVKVLITQGQNPFLQTENNLNDIFKKRVEKKRLNGDWVEHTIENYELFYDKVLRKPIGHKKLNKITYEDLVKILENKDFLVKKNVWKNRLKQILNPIFKDALKQGTVFINPCDKVENFYVEETEEVHSKIVDDNILYLSQELYRAIKKYPVKSKHQEPEYQCFLYMVLLTARRIGEITKLTKEDCYITHKKIISPKNITKTKKEFEFPIPDECINYIKSVKEGNLFPNIKRASVYLMFQRLIKFSDIELRKGKILTVHNTRDLMLNIMIQNEVDSRLADFCLDHKAQGTIKNYISFTFSQQKEALEKYWALVRNDEMSLKKEEFRKEFFKYYEYEFNKAWDKELEKLSTTREQNIL
jgi:integrase